MNLYSTICLEAIFYNLFVIVFRKFTEFSFSLSIIEAGMEQWKYLWFHGSYNEIPISGKILLLLTAWSNFYSHTSGLQQVECCPIYGVETRNKRSVIRTVFSFSENHFKMSRVSLYNCKWKSNTPPHSSVLRSKGERERRRGWKSFNKSIPWLVSSKVLVFPPIYLQDTSDLCIIHLSISLNTRRIIPKLTKWAWFVYK